MPPAHDTSVPAKPSSMELLFEKRQVEITQLELYQYRANQILSALTYLVLRVGLAALGIAGAVYYVWKQFFP